MYACIACAHHVLSLSQAFARVFSLFLPSSSCPPSLSLSRSLSVPSFLPPFIPSSLSPSLPPSRSLAHALSIFLPLTPYLSPFSFYPFLSLSFPDPRCLLLSTYTRHRKQLAVYHNNRAAARWNIATAYKKETTKDEVIYTYKHIPIYMRLNI